VLAYALLTQAKAPGDVVRPVARATQGELAAARGEAQRALEAAGFLNPQSPELVLAELVRCWERAELTPREAELWRNAFRKLAQALQRR
jgi:tRNA C32,U32 (ribose-2'-O)-methylase TrmJ